MIRLSGRTRRRVRDGIGMSRTSVRIGIGILKGGFGYEGLSGGGGQVVVAFVVVGVCCFNSHDWLGSPKGMLYRTKRRKDKGEQQDHMQIDLHRHEAKREASGAQPARSALSMKRTA